MSKIYYALVGFGGIAENRIAKEGFACDRQRFSALPNAELIGAFDVDSTKRSNAEELDLKWYDSLDAVLADKTLDAVFIATNNLTHADIAEKALLAGKHVIIEKPIATTIEAAKKLAELAKAKGLSLTVDHMMKQNVYNQQARELISNGSLGTVNDACLHMEFCYGATPEEAATWRCANPEELGGPIGDVASHCFYMAEYLLGQEINEVACVYLPKLMDMAVEDGAYIKYTMSNGISGSIKVAFSESRGGLGGTLSNLGYEIYGTEAVLRGYGTMFQLSGHEEEPLPIRLELDKFKVQEQIQPVGIKNIYQSLIEEHAASILTGDILDAEEALHNIKLCLMAHESARTGGIKKEVE